MNIVFLMAGRGSRFKEEGFKEPKALIELHGKPMFSWAVDSLAFIKNPERYFLILKEHEEHGLSDQIKKRYKDAHVVIVDRVTNGAAETALLIKKTIDTDKELIISNADQYFRSHEFEKVLSTNHGYAGIIPTFESTHPRWSFAKTNSEGLVIEVAEKVPISNNATVGVYYFRHGKDFVWAASEMIEKDIRRNNEFYICPVFNELIGRGDKIQAVPTEAMWSMGTPEDVQYFKKYFKEDL